VTVVHMDTVEVIAAGSVVGIGLSALLSLLGCLIGAWRGARSTWRHGLWAAGAGVSASMIAAYMVMACAVGLKGAVSTRFWHEYQAGLALVFGLVPIVAAVAAVIYVIRLCTRSGTGI